ncbi:hypothetical protein FUT87_05540 [Mitsuaria sp. TWR114]|uniref:hypothetical protein n=1 Tax=unclassified Roseateles TaxID=2626991 RepID=UPI0011BDC9C7|nr:hypothetical protein [Mitsuaria sp. TWR114]TXD96694.1 hypothetical protein FUT87_05540 [Mitsuaria sp. TWR114]
MTFVLFVTASSPQNASSVGSAFAPFGHRMPAASSSLDPDLEGLAEQFALKAEAAPDDALREWSESTTSLRPELQAAAARIANQRLTWRARALLSTRPNGAALLMQWSAEVAQRPRLMRLQGTPPRSSYAYCASLVLQRGSRAAAAGLREGRLTIVGLRRDTSTLDNKGRGVYDDDIVVLNGAAGLHSVRVFPACTEPGAQYSQRAKPVASGGRVDPRYAGVTFKKIEGADVNGDGILDAGRLRAGTYLFAEKDGGYMDARAFQSLSAQVAERDTNGDGRFNASDPNRIDLKGAGTSMYIHRGGIQANRNTWSAGCQTVPDNRYGAFLASLGRIKTFHYVLIDGD